MEIFTQNALLFAVLLLPLLLFLRLEYTKRKKTVFAVIGFVLALAAGAAVILTGGGMPELLLVVLVVLAVCI